MEELLNVAYMAKAPGGPSVSGFATEGMIKPVHCKRAEGD